METTINLHLTVMEATSITIQMVVSTQAVEITNTLHPLLEIAVSFRTFDSVFFFILTNRLALQLKNKRL